MASTLVVSNAHRNFVPKGQCLDNGTLLWMNIGALQEDVKRELPKYIALKLISLNGIRPGANQIKLEFDPSVTPKEERIVRRTLCCLPKEHTNGGELSHKSSANRKFSKEPCVKRSPRPR
ncbi:MAG: hypothetical protein COU90_02745 [Candidatus Ryanbacteria bacterium CG10_big_fil_rev_8_21_14_0_10_43_42]|uniref:Uncharacterized protein n=1 Tax=Candidatus Ryanbacteria bacterium CG10_big_fil_rev_8_21_14_0_10_43_42 TaxID=1974864 RepID=A0A2M8KWN5_9BACT|nr:MAG: hypothetical protein COU90_02745 [Candidatus Ryanbacteria bacterium CG10_big_fil_rev_8_21_14_0_10_43_42]